MISRINIEKTNPAFQTSEGHTDSPEGHTDCLEGHTYSGLFLKLCTVFLFFQDCPL